MTTDRDIEAAAGERATEQEVERVARALARADGKDPDQPAWWSPRNGAFGICWRDQYADKARAAITAYLPARTQGEGK